MRRDLLAKSLSQMTQPSVEPKVDPPAPSVGVSDGAPKSLKSMSEVLSQVSSMAAQPIDTREIADSDVQDRFDVNVGLEELVSSIKASGQEIPVLLRYRRGAGPRYEIVYGRRRIAACRELGIPVNALIRDMSERDALMSHALENSARLQRSFIEQAVFAARLEEHSFSREEICEALAIDKGALSRLLGVARDIPSEIITRIGAAHEVGRRPWLDLRSMLKEPTAPKLDELLELLPQETDPLKALLALIDALSTSAHKQKTAPSKAAPRARPVSLSGAPVRFVSKAGKITIESTEQRAHEFIRHLEEHLLEIYEGWSKSNPQDGSKDELG